MKMMGPGKPIKIRKLNHVSFIKTGKTHQQQKNKKVNKPVGYGIILLGFIRKNL